MGGSLENYWERINFFCRMGTLNNWELHFEEALYLYRLFAEMQNIINPKCSRRWHPHFNAHVCRQCRTDGKDTKTCQMIYRRECILRDCLLENS